MQIGIIGAGHAGLEAAVAAQQAGAKVTIFSAEATLPYFRPRLIAVAMGQTAPEEIAMHPAVWYTERGIQLRLATPVTAIDVAARTIEVGGGREKFDALVIACGAVSRRPRFAGEIASTRIFTLWSMDDARAILAHVRPGLRLLIIGGACLGVEAALRACAQKQQVVIVELATRLMPLVLGEQAAGCLRRQLEAKGIGVRTGHAVAAFLQQADGTMGVKLDDGSVLEADVALLCIGAAPNLTLARQAGLATDRGILTDACLQAAPGVFVAGDVCQAAGHAARGAVREAAAQGRVSGANAVASISGEALQTFSPAVVPITVHYAGIDVNVAGHASGEGIREERLDDGTQHQIVRACTRNADGQLAGVQMLGTRAGFDELVGQMAG